VLTAQIALRILWGLWAMYNGTQLISSLALVALTVNSFRPVLASVVPRISASSLPSATSILSFLFLSHLFHVSSLIFVFCMFVPVFSILSSLLPVFVFMFPLPSLALASSVCPPSAEFDSKTEVHTSQNEGLRIYIYKWANALVPPTPPLSV